MSIPRASQPGGLRREQGQLVLWTPDRERCAALVKKGAIPGMVDEGGDVILDRLMPEQTLRIVSGEQGGCLRWTEPVVFVRLGKSLAAVQDLGLRGDARHRGRRRDAMENPYTLASGGLLAVNRAGAG